MKKSTILLLLVVSAVCVFSNVSFGQEKKPWSVRRVYLNLSGGTNGYGIYQLNTHFNNRWVGFISYTEGSTASKKLPVDYQTGSTTLIGFEFDNGTPSDQFYLVTAGMGKVISPLSDKAWIIVTGGISIGQLKETQYSKQNIESFNFLGLLGGTSSNYATSVESKSMAGINTGLEGHVNLFRFMGLSAGAKITVTNCGVYPYLNFGMNMGLMRPAKKNMIGAAK